MYIYICIYIHWVPMAKPRHYTVAEPATFGNQCANNENQRFQSKKKGTGDLLLSYYHIPAMHWDVGRKKHVTPRPRIQICGIIRYNFCLYMVQLPTLHPRVDGVLDALDSSWKLTNTLSTQKQTAQHC